jgi:hypothetical protein
LVVENNRVECTGYGMGIGGQNDTPTIQGNYDVLMSGNYFYRTGFILIGQMTRFVCDRNTFVGINNGTPGFNSVFDLGLNITTSYMSFTNNKAVIDGVTNYFITQEASHTTNASTNLDMNNDTGGLASNSLWKPAASGQVLTTSAVIDVTSISAGNTYLSVDIPLVGAALGDYIEVTCSIYLQGMLLGCFVKASDVVRFTLYNNTGVSQDPASATYYFKATKR